MSFECNVYYNPEKCGLEIIDCLDEADLSYEYHTLIALKHLPTGRVFAAEDSGCSCPTPFETFNFDGPDSHNLDEITLANFLSFEQQVNNFPATAKERDDMLDKVKKVLHG